uniref:Uncharacterized protein n=1 Tax=Apteryx owenii TaxID=8824 RepID=A0A8B9PK80_APTOW
MNFFDFPSFSVGPCMTTHFPEMAGKNTMPAARSYSSRCSQTQELVIELYLAIQNQALAVATTQQSSVCQFPSETEKLKFSLWAS